MARQPNARDALLALPQELRLRLAKTRTEKLVGHVLALFQMHEANAIALYSSTLVDQIPRSYAARAFRQFQQSMYLHELVRLAAIWDGIGTDRQSVPTIVHLYNDPAIVDQRVEAQHAYFAAMAPPQFDDPAMAWAAEAWEAERRRRADEEAGRVRTALEKAATRCQEVRASAELAALIDLRNRAIAHNLDDDDETQTEGEANVWRYGVERTILEWTVEVVDHLHFGLTGASFHWDGSRDQAKRNAERLWGACTFDIPEVGRRISTGD